MPAAAGPVLHRSEQGCPGLGHTHRELCPTPEWSPAQRRVHKCLLDVVISEQ